MFGTIAAQVKLLQPEEQARYKACYCGMCYQLDTQFGSIGCASLSHDMTFLSILLGCLYNLPETGDQRRCVPHPVKQHAYVTSEATAYASDMNLVLSYYQCLDDWNDDHNRIAKEKSKLMARYLPDIRLRHPRPCAAIERTLETLGGMEKANELNPDLPANCFGELMAELFVWRQDEHEPLLRGMGAALGRFIYLMDAVNDLRADIKKQRYNPLVAQMDTDFTPMLTMMMAECTQSFEQLPFDREERQLDLRILHNILYSGVWQKYRLRKREGKET